jgi:hypothetical protein
MLEKITAEREKIRDQEIALSGRGARRRAAITKVVLLIPIIRLFLLTWQFSQTPTSMEL